MTSLTPLELKMQRQNTAIDLELLRDAERKKDSKLYTERFIDVLEKAKAGDEAARRNLVEMRQKRAPFTAEDLLQLVISHAKNLDPTSENQQDFLGPIMAISNIFVNQENGEIQKKGNSTLDNIQTLIAIESIGSGKMFSTNRFYYDGEVAPQTFIESNVNADGIYAEIFKPDSKTGKDNLITRAHIGDIHKGKQEVTNQLFNSRTLSNMNNGTYTVKFKNKNGYTIDLKPKIKQRLDSYDFKNNTVETEGGIIRDITEIAK